MEMHWDANAPVARPSQTADSASRSSSQRLERRSPFLGQFAARRLEAFASLSRAAGNAFALRGGVLFTAVEDEVFKLYERLSKTTDKMPY